MSYSRTGRYSHKPTYRSLLSAAIAYEASLTPEEKARLLSAPKYREATDDEDPFTLHEIKAEENPFPPFTPDPARARRIVCADGITRSFAIAEGAGQ